VTGELAPARGDRSRRRRREGSGTDVPRTSATSRPGATRVAGAYRDHARVRWQVAVRHPAKGRWEVCETSDENERRLIEELAGDGESDGSALALARDYLEQHTTRPGRAASG
jgi:hypothetical protein